MSKLYFLYTSFKPNTAPTNRFLSFLEGFSRLGIDVEVIFFLSDESNSRITKDIPHIHITYMWDKINVKNRYLRQLSYSYLSLLFMKKVKSGDKVVLFNPQRVMFPLLQKTGVEVYAERTEHPFVYKLRTINMHRYVAECKNLDGLFVISTALKDYFVRKGVPQDRIHVINMTVDPERFKELKKIPTENKYIAYCGTASNNKDGVDELIKSFAIVSKKHPEYKLYIIGNGLTKDDISGNRKLVENLGLKDKIKFTGVVNSTEMPQLLKNAEVLALDRPDNQQAKFGFPTKLGEYLLTENPVVITSVGDIPLFLEDGKSALIAEPQNPEAFASKLIWAIEHPIESSEIGHRGAEIAYANFNALVESEKIAHILGY